MTSKKTGLVVGKFAPFHKGHQLVIERALECCSNVIVLVYSNPDFDSMPSIKRAAWIKEIYDAEAIEVFVPESPPENAASNFVQREFVKQWLTEYLPESHITKVFGSESYLEGFAKHLGVTFELVDLARQNIKTSGTALREELKRSGGNHASAILKTYLHPIVLKSLLAKH